ncbi:MAG: flagellar hook basal-body protein [Nitrospiraceae bacterium]|nr:flagellar hook basal-body protein [Nitrospiraceae bacterium]
MYKGIYIALSGAVLKQLQMDTISSNLANASTIAFKKDTLSFKDYLVNRLNGATEPDGRDMSTLSGEKTDFSEGEMFKTGNPLDVALSGDGFIALEGGFYTRRGDLKLNGDGFLTAYNGMKVLGAKGPIQIQGGTVDIGSGGEVSVDGKQIGTIKLVQFNNTSALKQTGLGLYTSSVPGTASSAKVREGFLESSNVNVMEEVVNLVESVRQYETFQKAIQTFDDAAGRVIEDMARV